MRFQIKYCYLVRRHACLHYTSPGRATYCDIFEKDEGK